MRTKREVRHTARARRRELAAAMDASGTRDIAGRRIADAVLALLARDGRSGPHRVAAYESLPSEPPTGPLVAALLAAGHEVIVPITLEDYSLQWTYAAHGTVGDQGTVTRGAPAPEVATLGLDALATCDLVITPGLTVDPRGVRLGQGGGCYDRALAHGDRAVPVVTLLYEGEASEGPLPADEHDRLVDAYLTTTGRYVPVRTAPGPRSAEG